jgi:hypothetical protein
MKIYQFRISIMGIAKCYRIVEATENCTFNDLHDTIFDAFNRYDSHLYSFFITLQDTKNMRRVCGSPEITHPQNSADRMGFGKRKKSAAKTRLGDVDLSENDVFHYLFDFGDDWWHRIRVQKISESKTRKKHIGLIKSVGESPPQYADDDGFDDDDD